jgi:hypothetical protein
VLRELASRLDDLAREAAAEARYGEPLAAIAREVGPDLSAQWEEWIGRLAPLQASGVWRAVAEAWLRQRRDPCAPELWQALSALKDHPSEILAFVPGGLGAMDLKAPAEIIQHLEDLLPDSQSRGSAIAVLLGQLALRDPELACASWEDWSAHAQLVWSPELVDDGREVLGYLEPQRIEEISTSIDDPSARAALRVIVLEARRTSEAATAALAELRAVPDGPAKLHWSLRYLTARPAESLNEVRGQVLAVGRYLHAIGFAADARDLARWLDLVALYLPEQIRSQLDSVLWSPELTPEKALTLADAATQEALLDLLLERVERCAASLSPTEADGFILRKNLMIRATCRLCEITRRLECLTHISSRLLPEEEDEIRSLLAPRLSVLSEVGRRLAEEICAGIGDRRLRLLTLLRSAPGVPPETLAPAPLYAAMARVEVLLDECQGLMALLETPADPRELLQRLVLPIGEARVRTRALLRLARHALEFETACHDKPDLLAPLELVRWLITTESDEELASLTPEIAALGAGAGGSRSTAEIQEAARQLAALETVAWPVRREALENLLARLASGLLPAREATKALTTILRLTAQLRPETARQQLREHWSEILPLVVAAVDRLPEKHLRPLRRALEEGLRGFTSDAAQQRIFALCLTPSADREKTASPRIGTAISELEALVYLFLKPSPHRVPEVVEQLPMRERAPLILRLLRHGWLPEETARGLSSLVAGSEDEAEAEVWCGPKPGAEPAWLERAALWIAGTSLTPSSVEVEPLLSRLWSTSEAWRPALAWAAQDSLRRGGWSRGEAILRTWLHAHLAPRLGQGRPDGLMAAREAAAALRLALQLGPERSAP